MNAQAQQFEIFRQSDAGYLVTAGLRGSEYIDSVRQLCPGSGEGSRAMLSGIPELKSLVLISNGRFGFLAGKRSWRWDQPETFLAQRESLAIRGCGYDPLHLDDRDAQGNPSLRHRTPPWLARESETDRPR
jgi:hypothetical protein